MKKSDDKMTQRARKYVARVRKIASDENFEFTEWEDEFLTSLDERLEKFGRAFNDPDLGAMNAPLSLRQGLKIKQIRKKALANKNDDAHENAQIREPKLQKPRKPLKSNKPLVAKSGFKRKTSIKR